MEDMTTILQYIFNAALCGTIAYTWIMIILDAENFGWIYEGANWIMKRTAVTRWLFKPMFHCMHCNAGQLALWFYLIFYGLQEYNPWYHIGFIAISITTAQIIKKKYG
jgi:hypothetical protein